MAQVELNCPSCHKRYLVPAKFAGKTTRCKNCSELIPIPAKPPVPTCSVCGETSGDVIERDGRFLCPDCAAPDAEPVATAAPVSRRSKRTKDKPAATTTATAAGPAPERLSSRGRLVVIIAVNVMLVAALATGLYLYAHSQSRQLNNMIRDAERAAEAGDLRKASATYDALFDRVAQEKVSPSMRPALDTAMRQWQQIVSGLIASSDQLARDGKHADAAKGYGRVAALSNEALVPEPSRRDVTLAMTRYHRLYLDLIDDADRRATAGDFLKASDSYRQLHQLVSAGGDVPGEVERDVRLALDEAWPELYRDQISRARARAREGAKEEACKLYAPLVAEKGLIVPASVAEELKRAKGDALALCPELAR